MLCIIDGDVLCYQACEARWKTKCTNNLNIISLDDEGNKKALEFTKAEDTKYMMDSWENFQQTLQEILEATYADDYVMAVKGKDNYRDLLYPEYKANRHTDPLKRNEFVPAIRELAVMQGLAVASTGREADDMLRIWAEEAKLKGEETIICSIDKDLKCIPGLHYLMHPIIGGKKLSVSDSRRIVRVTPEEAIRHYYEQMLKGDPTDNIPGVPRVGDKTAPRILAPYSTEEEFQEQVVDQYIMAYGENWFEYLNSNGKMIHLQLHVDDYFDCLQWPVVKELRG